MSAALSIRSAAVLVVLLTYAAVVRSGEARVAAERARNDQSALRLADGVRALATRAALDAERARLRARLRRIDRADTGAARFVRDAAAAAANRRARITAMAGSRGAGAASSLELTVEGRYADVLDAVRAFGRTSIPASIALTSLARVNTAAGDATVTATVRAALDPAEPPRIRRAGAGVAVRRDPFAGMPVPAPARANGPALPSSAGAIPPLPPALAALPANAGAPPPPFAAAAPSARVTAIVTGPPPFALVDEGDSTRVVTLGDRIAGEAVGSITADGVRLAHGTVLHVTSAAAPARRNPGELGP